MDAHPSLPSRGLSRVVSPPPPAPGFIGAGHTAVEVLHSEDLAGSDPFVLLMDDRLDIGKRRQIGGAHPHAGLETVTLILEGTLWDRDEGPQTAGDAVWMTAGRGIVHSEHIEVEGRARVLQLWIRLPSRDRDLPPSFELIAGRDAPVRREHGAVARLYSGSTGELRSPTQNRVPITLVDLALEPGATFTQELPLSYNGFFYVLAGDAGVAGTDVREGQVGWLDRPGGSGTSALTFTAGPHGARLVLYTGEPQRESLVHRGPFVAGSADELNAYYQSFRRGNFPNLSELAAR